MQSEGNSYALETDRRINVDHYFEQPVEVTGSETPALGTSSTSMERATATPSVTIMEDLIHVVAKRCTH